MGINSTGMAHCDYCGAQYRLFTIFNRDMQGLCKAWRRRHERACSKRTPAQRREWARPYIGKDMNESSLTVNLEHPGFLEGSVESLPKRTEASQTRGKPAIVAITPAGADHQVVTVQGGQMLYRRTPCSDCPWRVDATGEFPPEAFRHSATTAYDMASNTFACHQSGTKKPAICAGFLLRGTDHNLRVRLARITGEIHDDVTDGGYELHESYRDMAISNGVDEDDPILRPCR